MRTKITDSLREALLRYYDQRDILDIERVSGDKLSMGHCFINLGIISHTTDKCAIGGRVKVGSDVTDPSSQFNLWSRLKVDTHPNAKHLSLTTMFGPHRDLSAPRPHHIWIWGRAGIGKTTLCKKIVYDFLHNSLWNHLFDCVFWLPLRRLKLMENCPRNVGEMLKQEYFRDQTGPYFTVERLQQVVNHQDERILFILDGLDEIYDAMDAQSTQRILLDDLQGQKNVIITSRPHPFPRFKWNTDLELETIGFSPEQIDEYLQGQEKPQVASGIRDFLANKPLLRTLCRIPIQLDMICYTWSVESPKYDGLSMTALYWKNLRLLCQKDIPRLKKRDKNDELINQQQLAVYSTEELLDVVSDEISLLETLAFDGFCDATVEFNQERIRKANSKFGYLPDSALFPISFLRSSDNSIDAQNRTYHFLHLTFQEFFAANYFVSQWQISAQQPYSTRPELENLIRNEKYNPRYDIFWRFVAGLFQIRAVSLLVTFFDILEEEPRDLIGPMHQKLIIRCLSETVQQQNTYESLKAKIRSLEQDFITWVKHDAIWTRLLISSTLREECPESIWQQLLLEGTVKEIKSALRAIQEAPNVSSSTMSTILEVLDSKSKGVALCAFGVLAIHSSEPFEKHFQRLIHTGIGQSTAIKVMLKLESLQLGDSAKHFLTSLYQNADSTTQSHIAVILGRQKSLQQPFIDILLRMLQDEDSHKRVNTVQDFYQYRFYCSKVLWEQLSAATVAALVQATVELICSRSSSVKRSVVGSLHSARDLPVPIIDSLIPLLQVSNCDVRGGAADVLRFQESLSPSSVDSLTALLEDADPDIRKLAIRSLARHKTLPESTVNCLHQLLRDDNSNICSLAASSLREQTNMSRSILDSLTQSITDKDPSVHKSSLWALSTHSKLVPDMKFGNLWDAVRENIPANFPPPPWTIRLPEPIVGALVQLLQDSDDVVRETASTGLRRQDTLSKSSIEGLTQLLADRNPNIRISSVQALLLTEDLPRETVEQVTKLLQDSESDVRIFAAHTLRKRRDLPKSAIDGLSQLALDSSLDVRSSAMIALLILDESIRLPVQAVDDLLHCRWLQGRYFGGLSDPVKMVSRQHAKCLESIEKILDFVAERNSELGNVEWRPLPDRRNSPSHVAGKHYGMMDEVVRTLSDCTEFYHVIPSLRTLDLQRVLKAWSTKSYSRPYSRPYIFYISDGKVYFDISQATGPQIVEVGQVQLKEFRQRVMEARMSIGCGTFKCPPCSTREGRIKLFSKAYGAVGAL
ncbi:MAG: hypothetical protein M1814_006258 [Vezdaea aestivalis]|nr:MAG: hypothetical protein M1814_006258 [Vezdaea aestivalis]